MYFDLQVNGYGGVDFNQDELAPPELHRACVALQRDGVEQFLPTIITDDLPVMERRLRRLAGLRAQDPLAERMIAGLHVEGPFISPHDGYRGAHPRDAVRTANERDAMRLWEACEGLARIFTLAPEADPNSAVISRLVKEGVVVAAGHTNATLAELSAAIDAGLSLFTHLGNGCPPLLPRHDNIIQRTLSLADRLWISFIADGAHVPYFALGNYLQKVGIERAILVTDAIAPAGLGPGSYTLGRWKLEIGPDLVARSPDGSHLVGSACGMPRVAENLRTHLGLSDEDLRRIASINPRRALTSIAGASSAQPAAPPLPIPL